MTFPPRGPDRRKPRPIAHSAADLEPSATPSVERRGSGERRLRGYIAQMLIFAGVAQDQVEPILARCPLRRLAVGEILLTPGQQNNAIHVLLAGELRIHLKTPDAVDYIPVMPGGCIGELSIIDGKPVSAYVVAAAECSVMRIHEQTFWDELIPMPGVARNLLKVLSDRMRLNNEMIIQRLAEHLRLEHLERELQTASGIQASMLPSRFPLFPERTDVDLHAMMRAAREVGGDFYDAFFISPTRLFVAIGDVSGKGVPAALFMARSMTLLRMEALRDRAPHEILAQVNIALCAGNETGMFVTVFCAVLDTDSGVLAYSNAGHNPPLENVSGNRYVYMQPPRGLVLGIAEDAPFKPARLQMRRGTSVLLYTDGVTEAANDADQMYSDERLLAFLGTLEKGASTQATVAAVCADVERFVAGAEPSDDITLLALTYHGAA